MWEETNGGQLRASENFISQLDSSQFACWFSERLQSSRAINDVSLETLSTVSETVSVCIIRDRVGISDVGLQIKTDKEDRLKFFHFQTHDSCASDAINGYFQYCKHKSVIRVHQSISAYILHKISKHVYSHPQNKILLLSSCKTLYFNLNMQTYL